MNDADDPKKNTRRFAVPLERLRRILAETLAEAETPGEAKSGKEALQGFEKEA